MYGQGKEANGAMLTGALTSLHLMPSKALSIRSFAVGCSHGVGTKLCQVQCPTPLKCTLHGEEQAEVLLGFLVDSVQP